MLDELTDGREKDINGKRGKKKKKLDEEELKTPEQREKERKERQLKGKPGKGTSDMYEFFCKHCHLEFVRELPNDECTKCSHPVVSREERKAELKAKVDVLVQAKKDRMQRRYNYHQYMESKKRDANTIVNNDIQNKENNPNTDTSINSNTKNTNTNTNTHTHTSSSASPVPVKLSEAGTDYAAWDFWEPETDDEDSDAEVRL